MKKTLVFVLLSFSFLNFESYGGKINKGQIDEKAISFLKENYGWNKEDFLVISFRQPKNKCHYDNYKNLSKTNRAIAKFSESIEEKSTRNILVSSDAEKVKAYVDLESSYIDFEDFILKTFFEKANSCYGLVVINNEGRYMSIAGEFVTKDVNSFIHLLKLGY
ncbi:hypothetical protein [Winogradskyella jejuensis]|uniref:Uncharacterized protein n=1 Tax=Winogradskyella jejuensis TaxID=1089305 RepID=A0A1M5SBG4_9FLAO|nr:hypothetical protein [Winogradskyella jejuensis]SHH35253.1 hypothetical protein SAMN05444148_1809 [Winogradskyella jejuensis]